MAFHFTCWSPSRDVASRSASCLLTSPKTNKCLSKLQPCGGLMPVDSNFLRLLVCPYRSLNLSRPSRPAKVLRRSTSERKFLTLLLIHNQKRHSRRLMTDQYMYWCMIPNDVTQKHTLKSAASVKSESKRKSKHL